MNESQVGHGLPHEPSLFKTKPLHLLVERRAIDPQGIGGEVAVPLVAFEHFQNDLPLRRFERLLERASGDGVSDRPARPRSPPGQILQPTISPLPSSTARSTTFCSSRTLPGQR